jgi:hypothetical protein
LKRTHAECSKYESSTEEFRKRVVQLEEVNEKLHGKMMQSESDKKILES